MCQNLCIFGYLTLKILQLLCFLSIPDSCQRNQLTCSNGQCVKQEELCNGNVCDESTSLGGWSEEFFGGFKCTPCKDGSDENEEICDRECRLQGPQSDN